MSVYVRSLRRQIQSLEAVHMPLAEAARVLGIDPGTLRVQIHNGKLKAKKLGPLWVVTPKEVERYRQQSLRQ